MTDQDLEKIGNLVADRLARHKCTHGLLSADVVFLQNLRKSAENTASIVWKSVLVLLGLGLLGLLIVGFYVAGLQLLSKIGV